MVWIGWIVKAKNACMESLVYVKRLSSELWAVNLVKCSTEVVWSFRENVKLLNGRGFTRMD